ALNSDKWESNMGGFWLLVDKENKCADYTEEDFANIKANDHGFQAVTPNMTHTVDKFAPMMICVGGDWCWPQELKHIDKAYPSSDVKPGFRSWLNNSKLGQAWYGEGGTEGVIVKRESLKFSNIK
ncbi:MAG: hypothetical protein J1E29_06835, partial [Duncaniella sp.]|nr:hypothetical protein [Duncaniella sp.]